MKTICVAGGTSRAGKTTFSSKLLARLPGWSACKVTTCVEGAGEPCPRGDGDGCGVCSNLLRPFEIDEDDGGEATAAKDTGRLRAAGAERVLWVRTRTAALAESVWRALDMLKDSPGVILEGNHVLQVHDPDVAVMVLPESRAMKESAREVRDKVDIFAEGFEDADALELVLRAVAT